MWKPLAETHKLKHFTSCQKSCQENEEKKIRAVITVAYKKYLKLPKKRGPNKKEINLEDA